MADQPQPGAISAAFPAPPPFYKFFTTQNLERQKEYLTSIGQSFSEPPSISDPNIDLLALPPELRNLFPPPPPPDGKYRSFGEEHDIFSTSAIESQTQPTPSRLYTLTHNLLLSFLSLTNVLATNPGAYAPIWEDLHASFKEAHEVINGYRPHQARETLILMMQEQVEKVRAETQAVQDSVERARNVLEGLGKGERGTSQLDPAGAGKLRRDKQSRSGKDSDRRVWEVLEKEFRR